jgi:hypothetical protein
MKYIKLKSASIGEVKAVVSSENPITAHKILDALPISGSANIWGEEIYFEIPVRAERENCKTEVEIGDIAYWPDGSAVCIFFGRTPISNCEKPVAYSPVNVFAKIVGDTKIFKKVKNGEKIVIEKC